MKNFLLGQLWILLIYTELIDFLIIILSAGLVGIESTTNLSAKKEMILVYKINKKRFGRSSKGINIYKLLKEYKLHNQLSMITNEAKTSTIKWIVDDPTTLKDQVIDLLEKLDESKSIVIIRFTTGGSIVVWFSCKSKEALQKLRSIIESGDLQICLTIIFTLLSDSSQELKVNIKAYTTDLKWAEDYYHEKG